MTNKVDVVVVGAGQAGLAVSYHLKEADVAHVVFERGDVGESWRSHRWDSFCLNTPNWANGLSGMAFDPEHPHDFGHRDELVSYLDRYVNAFDLPVQPRSPVERVERLADGRYATRVADETYHSRALVLATGSMSRPRVPKIAERLPAGIVSLSAGEYRNPESLPAGAVVVVGTGQSGCQVAEDLLAAGRRVFVCASRVARVVRNYRGRDIIDWWRDMRFWDVGVDELEDPSVQYAVQPHISGTDGGHTVSFQSLARDGATLLGRVIGIEGNRVTLADNLLEAVAFSDERSAFFKKMIDDWIKREDVSAEPPSHDPGEPPLPDLGGSEKRTELDLTGENVGAVIWCTGFDADWSWVGVDVFDENGRPVHHHGLTNSEGLYFVGFPWLSKRSSGILLGVSDDAQRIVRHLCDQILDA